MKKALVAYFSASGTTEAIAKKLADAAGADLFEIRPLHPYTDADLDWTNKKSRSTVEMNDPSARPEMAEQCENTAEYDTIFVGFPIWWYVAPRIIDTFLESGDLRGKTIVPFATSGGSGMGKTVDVFRRILGPDVTVKEGKMLNRASDAEIRAWLRSLGV